jgi:hypothetical protein
MRPMILETLGEKLDAQNAKLASLRAERAKLQAQRTALWIAQDIDGANNDAALVKLASAMAENETATERAELVLGELLERRSSIELEIAAVHHKSALVQLEALNSQTAKLDREFSKHAAPFFAAWHALATHERAKRATAAAIGRYCDSHPDAPGVGAVASAHRLTVQAAGEVMNFDRLNNLALSLTVSNSTMGIVSGASEHSAAVLGLLAEHYK